MFAKFDIFSFTTLVKNMIAIELDRAQIDKTGEIAAILENDRAAFQKWLSQAECPTNLCIPKEALLYLAISQRLMELVEKPKRLYPVVCQQKPRYLNFKVHYLNLYPVSEQQLLDIYLLAYTNKEGKNVLNVAKYGDCKPWRGLGIATSFYQRLREAARAMGFWIITGNNDAGNIGFFRDKLGRIPFSLINPEFGGLFFPSIEDAIQPAMSPLTTIDFLYPEDKAKYC